MKTVPVTVKSWMSVTLNLVSPVVFVVSLDDGTMGISLASFHHLAAGVAEDLENPVLAVLVGQRAHLHPLERDDALGRVLRRVLEIVQTPIVQDEPTPLPVLPVPTLQGTVYIFIITLFLFLPLRLCS